MTLVRQLVLFLKAESPSFFCLALLKSSASDAVHTPSFEPLYTLSNRLDRRDWIHWLDECHRFDRRIWP